MFTWQKMEEVQATTGLVDTALVETCMRRLLVLPLINQPTLLGGENFGLTCKESFETKICRCLISLTERQRGVIVWKVLWLLTGGKAYQF